MWYPTRQVVNVYPCCSINDNSISSNGWIILHCVHMLHGLSIHWLIAPLGYCKYDVDMVVSVTESFFRFLGYMPGNNTIGLYVLWSECPPEFVCWNKCDIGRWGLQEVIRSWGLLHDDLVAWKKGPGELASSFMSFHLFCHEIMCTATRHYLGNRPDPQQILNLLGPWSSQPPEPWEIICSLQITKAQEFC